MPPPYNMRDSDASHVFAALTAMELQLRKLEVKRARSNGYELEGHSNWPALSKQQVIDCCEACRNPRRISNLYIYLYQNGVTTEKQYPFVSSVYQGPQPCKNTEEPYYKIRDYYKVHSCRNLAEKLKLGPVVAWVDARKWRKY